MMLVDTDVLSLSAFAKAHPDQKTTAWLESIAAQIHVSEATLFEIQSGVTKLACTGATKKAKTFQDWLDQLVITYEGRFAPLDRSVLFKAGEIRGTAMAKGFAATEMDCCIAATAVLRGWTVATRNAKHFAVLGAKFIVPPSDRDPV
jgi:toxin FitB